MWFEYYTLLSIASCFTCFILYYWEKSMGSLPSSMTRGVLVIVYGCCCSGLYVFFCVFCNFVCSREICVSLNFSDWEKSHHLLQVTREGLFFYEITWKCSPGVLVIMYGYRCSCLYVVLCVSPNFFHWEKFYLSIWLTVTMVCVNNIMLWCLLVGFINIQNHLGSVFSLSSNGMSHRRMFWCCGCYLT